MIFLSKKPFVSALVFVFALTLLPFVFLGGCGLDDTGGGNLIYLESDGVLYCPAPYGWEVYGSGTEVSAKVGYGRKAKKKKCSAVAYGDGTFLVYGSGQKKTLLCRCDGDLPSASDANEENGVLLRLGESDILLNAEEAGNLLECICSERMNSDAETLSDVGLVFAVFPNVSAMKLLGTVRSVRGGGFVLCDENGCSFLLPDDFSVDTAQ